MRRSSLPLLLAASALALTSPAFAQDQSAPDSAHVEPHHDHSDDVIIVTGTRKSIDDVLGGVSVLDGADLASNLKPSLGDTLASQPGITSTSFGPAASRPVVRGLGGDRIRILTDGIGSLDLSSSSADHAVAINPLTADRIEILRGPSALLFGSSAIGGVINVIDSRIPRRDPERPLHVEGSLGYGSAANERSTSLSSDVPLGGGFVLHGDASWSKSDDLETGGYLLSRALRDEAAASPDAEVRDLADLRGKLPNTAARTREYAAGFAYVDGPLNAGFSVTRHEQKYGVPIRFSLDPDVEAEAPVIDARSTRYDGRVEVPVGGFLESIKLRGGYSRYRHDELEEGHIGTSFFTRGGEARMDLVQRERSGWGGTSGLQYVGKSVKVRGDEKYLPDARQKQFGLFTLQSLDIGHWRFEAGGRVEFSNLSAAADPLLGTADEKHDYTTLTVSAGGLYEFSPGWKVGLNLARSARAPAIDEVYANGPHAGTQAFEIGNLNLDPETSVGGELSLRHTRGPLRFSLTGFYSRFGNFIYLAPRGDIVDDLPVYNYLQGRARYSGFEAEIRGPIAKLGGVDLGFEAQADAVRATISGYGPAPQIPPLRLMGGLNAHAGKFDGKVEVEHALRQNRVAAVETPTPGYTLVNASVEWHPLEGHPELTLGLAADNIFDVVARRHTSLLKDYAPLAGRDIRLTLGFDF